MIQTTEQQNAEKLQTYNLQEITNRSTVRQVNGELVFYGNLLIEKQSGKILDLTPSNKVFSPEKGISTPVAIISSNFFNDNQIFRLELTRETDLPSSIKDTVIKSINIFNEFLLAAKH